MAWMNDHEEGGPVRPLGVAVRWGLVFLRSKFSAQGQARLRLLAGED